MLIGNYSVLQKSPNRWLSGSSVSDNRANFNKSGQSKNRFFGYATVASQTNKSALPNGYRSTYAWQLALKAGGLASINNLIGDGEVTSGNLAGGLNAEALLSGSGVIFDAALGLIASAVATLSGSGSISGDIVGKLEATADLAGSGDITGALGALADCVATLIGTGTLSSDVTAKAEMSADITPFTELSPEALAAAVWNAVATFFNTPGTMGEKLNDSGSASNPWATDIDGKTAGDRLKDADDQSFLSSVS